MYLPIDKISGACDLCYLLKLIIKYLAVSMHDRDGSRPWHDLCNFFLGGGGGIEYRRGLVKMTEGINF